MARNVATASNAHNAPEPAADDTDAVAAAVDAEVQTHHRILLCLEQSRRALNQMVHDCVRVMGGTAQTLMHSTDQAQWIQSSAALGWGLCSSAQAAQATMLAAWSELQQSFLDQARASGEVAQVCDWPFAPAQPAAWDNAAGNGADLQWLTRAVRMYEKLATEWTSAWTFAPLARAQH